MGHPHLHPRVLNGGASPQHSPVLGPLPSLPSHPLTAWKHHCWRALSSSHPCSTTCPAFAPPLPCPPPARLTHFPTPQASRPAQGWHACLCATPCEHVCVRLYTPCVLMCLLMNTQGHVHTCECFIQHFRQICKLKVKPHAFFKDAI